MTLFAERGYAGASLRELGRRVGVKQPSLYHYFASKEELLEQIFNAFGQSIFDQQETPPPTTSLSEAVRLVSSEVRRVLYTPDHQAFSRFLLRMAFEAPQLAVVFRAAIVEPVRAKAKLALLPHAEEAGLDEIQIATLARLLLNGLIMEYLYVHVLEVERLDEHKGDLADLVAVLIDKGQA